MRRATKTRTDMTLGKYLAAIRDHKGLTLRQVEDGTEPKVSNAYLSQLENDKITKPSPNTLYTLAEFYAIEYDRLMELAGYITSSKKTEDGRRHGRIATFSEFNLTPDEEAEMIDYLKYIRNRKMHHDKVR